MESSRSRAISKGFLVPLEPKLPYDERGISRDDYATFMMDMLDEHHRERETLPVVSRRGAHNERGRSSRACTAPVGRTLPRSADLSAAPTAREETK